MQERLRMGEGLGATRTNEEGKSRLANAENRITEAIVRASERAESIGVTRAAAAKAEEVAKAEKKLSETLAARAERNKHSHRTEDVHRKRRRAEADTAPKYPVGAFLDCL